MQGFLFKQGQGLQRSRESSRMQSAAPDPVFVIAIAGLRLSAARAVSFGEQIVGMVAGWRLVVAASIPAGAIL